LLLLLLLLKPTLSADGWIVVLAVVGLQLHATCLAKVEEGPAAAACMATWQAGDVCFN
jgi:hypothetical protein